VLFLVCDNLRKGAALNAIQISEILVGASLPSYFGQRAS
jgi:N-acetyl-gamma-glutamylphosphate reductase